MPIGDNARSAAQRAIGQIMPSDLAECSIEVSRGSRPRGHGVQSWRSMARTTLTPPNGASVKQ
jgi:hypothetical protein